MALGSTQHTLTSFPLYIGLNQGFICFARLKNKLSAVIELQRGKHLFWISCFFWEAGDFELTRGNYRVIDLYCKMDYRIWKCAWAIQRGKLNGKPQNTKTNDAAGWVRRKNCQEALLRGKSYKKDQSSGNQKKRGKFVDVIGNLKCLQHPKGNEIKPV